MFNFSAPARREPVMQPVRLYGASRGAASGDAAGAPAAAAEGAAGSAASTTALPARLERLVKDVEALPPFDKGAMRGGCDRETTRVELFMQKAFGFRNTRGTFVDGVRAFELGNPPAGRDDSEVVTFVDHMTDDGVEFKMSIGEIKRWQSTYRCFAPLDIYPGDEGLDLLQRSLAGGSASGDEAWRMKFAIRASKNPIYCTFNGRLRPRAVADPVADRIYLLSVSGIDFAGRKHDVADITTYIENASEIYQRGPTGKFVTMGGRDFWPTGVRAKVRKDRLWNDLCKMIHMRLRACDLLGVEVAVDTAIGLGVFAGEDIGVAPIARLFSASALRHVLETFEFPNIKMVICALPVFRPKDNYHVFTKAFESDGGYKGSIPVVMADNDMHALALAAAEAGFITSELNPADSHGVFGEYWQNRGPAVEEKLALTTAGLLTQHHVGNPAVLDRSNYCLLDLTATDGNWVVVGKAPLPARAAKDEGGVSGGAGGADTAGSEPSAADAAAGDAAKDAAEAASEPDASTRETAAVPPPAAAEVPPVPVADAASGGGADEVPPESTA